MITDKQLQKAIDQVFREYRTVEYVPAEAFPCVVVMKLDGVKPSNYDQVYRRVCSLLVLEPLPCQCSCGNQHPSKYEKCVKNPFFKKAK